MLWRSRIQTENDKKPKGFSPQTQDAQVGDAIFWINEDVGIEHQPCLSADNPGIWCKEPLSGPEPSNQVNLAAAGTIHYFCAIHPSETATIVVANAVDIGRTASGDVTFVPSTANIDLGESVSWANSDSEAHWPAPQDAPNDEWLAQPVGSGEVSPPVAFPNAGTFPYRCAMEGHKETGTIVASHLVSINPGTATAVFDPTPLSIALNDPVWWLNNDAQAHWPAPDSGAAWFPASLGAGAQSIPVTFGTAGSIPYHCTIHPTEKGTITVA